MRIPWQVSVLFAVTVWGASFVATKAALRELTPFALIGLRFGMGVAVLFATVTARREWRRVGGADLLQFALLGLIGVLLHQALQVHGLRMTSATNTGWMVALIPVFTAILARLVLGERLVPLRRVGIALAFAGALLVVGRGRVDASVLHLPSASGDLLAFLSAPNWAVFSVLSKPILKRHPAALGMAWVLLCGWIAVLPFFALEHGWAQVPHLSTAGWTALLFLGIACSGLAYVAWYDALHAAEASQVAAFLYLEPLVTVAVAAAALREPVTPPALAGGALILFGVWLVERRSANGRRIAAQCPVTADRGSPPVEPAREARHDS